MQEPLIFREIPTEDFKEYIHWDINENAWEEIDRNVKGSIWMTATLICQRYKIQQISDKTLIAERRLYRKFEDRHVKERAKIFQQTELCTIWHLIGQIIHAHWKKISERTNWILGCLNLFRKFCWKRNKEMQLRKIVLILRFHMFGFVMANCPQTNVFGSNVLTAQLTDTASVTISKFYVTLHKQLL
jgi:hypothetical protein